MPPFAIVTSSRGRPDLVISLLNLIYLDGLRKVHNDVEDNWRLHPTHYCYYRYISENTAIRFQPYLLNVTKTVVVGYKSL